MCLTPGGKALMINDSATGFMRPRDGRSTDILERQWFARKLENWPDAMNPDRPEESVKVSGPFGDEMRVQAWRLDYERKTWLPAWGYAMPYADNWQDDVIVGYGHGGNPLKKEAGHPGTWATFGWGAEGGLRIYKGRNYMLSGEGAIYTYGPNQPPKLVGMAFPHRCEVKAGRIHQCYDQGPNTWFTWADRNGDSRVQMSEVTVTTGQPLLDGVKRMSDCTLAANLDILFTGLTLADPATGACTRQYRLPLLGILDNGAGLQLGQGRRGDAGPALAQLRRRGWAQTRHLRLPKPSDLRPRRVYAIAEPSCAQ